MNPDGGLDVKNESAADPRGCGEFFDDPIEADEFRRPLSRACDHGVVNTRNSNQLIVWC